MFVNTHILSMLSEIFFFHLFFSIGLTQVYIFCLLESSACLTLFHSYKNVLVGDFLSISSTSKIFDGSLCPYSTAHQHAARGEAVRGNQKAEEYGGSGMQSARVSKALLLQPESCKWLPLLGK